MNHFKRISAQEYEALLKFPAYISMLAANSDDKLDVPERKAAIKFAHIKTFSCEPVLAEFYMDADKVFEHNINEIDQDLPGETDRREAAIKNELLNLEKIILKLGQKYASAMHRSMKSFKEHVSKAHNNVLVDFIFPISIPGLSD